MLEQFHSEPSETGGRWILRWGRWVELMGSCQWPILLSSLYWTTFCYSLELSSQWHFSLCVQEAPLATINLLFPGRVDSHPLDYPQIISSDYLLPVVGHVLAMVGISLCIHICIRKYRMDVMDKQLPNYCLNKVAVCILIYSNYNCISN